LPYSGGITRRGGGLLGGGLAFALGLPSGGHDWHAGSPEQPLSHVTLLSGGLVWTARRCGVRVAEWATGPDLPERVELVRAALPDADRARFEQDLDQR